MVDFCAERELWVGSIYPNKVFTKVHEGGLGSRRSGGTKLDISGVRKLCAEFKGSNRNGTRTLRSPCFVV